MPSLPLPSASRTLSHLLSASLLVAALRATAKDAEVVLHRDGSQASIQFLGDNDDDWHLQSSPDLLNWTTHTEFGVLHSGRGTNAVTRALTSLPEAPRFFRAMKTGGLYDSNLLRTISLTDEPNNPRKWQFPAGTVLPANGRLIVWADEDGSANSGLHASFKLDAKGEEIFLTDTDARLNVILDSVAFPGLSCDRSWARTADDPKVWADQEPTPGIANR